MRVAWSDVVVLTLNYPKITTHSHTTHATFTHFIYHLRSDHAFLRLELNASFGIRNLIPSSFVWYEFSFCSWQSDCSHTTTQPTCSTFNWLIHLNHFTLFLIELRKWFSLSRTFSDSPFSTGWPIPYTVLCVVCHTMWKISDSDEFVLLNYYFECDKNENRVDGMCVVHSNGLQC